MELPGVTPRLRLGSLLALVAALIAVLAGPPAAARAGTTTAVKTDPNAPVLVTSQTKPPTGFRLDAEQVERIAARSPVIVAELKRHPDARPYEYTKGPGAWQVSWFSSGHTQSELAQVYVDDATGRVTQAWTGFQVAWSMARGYPGAFGRRVNALYIWIPLCLAFVLPFIPMPRVRRRAWSESGGRSSRWPLTLLHLDLLMLLGFSISLALFNHAKIGLSVPLVYPFLLYLLVRMLLLAFGRGRPREPLRPLFPTRWLVVAVIFLVGFRIGLNLLNSNVIDVGYAGVIGADKIVHGHALYGGWPFDNASGDTYGPVVYFAYVPFRAIFGWSGTWDYLPAAHAAAIAFDLLTLVGLFLLGRRLRGPRLGVVLAYAWAAYPFTLWTLSSNTNDALVSLLLVMTLLVLSSAPARGIFGALAGLTKFAPLALAPLFLRGEDGGPLQRRSVSRFAIAYGLTAVVVMLYVILHANLGAFWRDSVAYQADRVTPFSIWGLWGGLGWEHSLVEGAAVGLALAAAFVPRQRGLVQVAALAGAILIALQLAANYWLYSYIVWFYPMVIVALFGSHPSELEYALRTEERAAGSEALVAA